MKPHWAFFITIYNISYRDAFQYLWKPDELSKLKSCSNTDSFLNRGRSLLVVVSTPPTQNYDDFTAKVRDYNQKEPFNFVTPKFFESQWVKVGGISL